MAKLIILRGLPASGKSTWARSWCEDPANTWPHCVISLDDIRLMIAGSAQVRNRLQSEHGKRFNDMVVAMGRHMIADALDAEWDVVADAQHANPRYAAERSVFLLFPLHTSLPELLPASYRRCYILHSLLFLPAKDPDLPVTLHK